MLIHNFSTQKEERLHTINEILSKKLLIIFSFLTFFLLSINITATSVGVISTYFNLPWGTLTFVTISTLSIALSYCFCRYFPFENYSKLLFLLGSVCFTIVIYERFNPVIEIRQDPSIYAFNAFNLLNHGTLVKPLHALGELIESGFYSFSEWKSYANIFNGTQSLVAGKLFGDFFPGGTYVYAFWGTLNKTFVFYGPTFIMTSVCMSLYFIIYKILNEGFSTFLLTCMFLLSPVMTWFGRAFYSGPFALLFFLLILFLLIDCFDFQSESRKLVLLILLFSLSYFSRLEMFAVLLIAIFLISYQNWKFGLLMLAMAIMVMVFAQNNYPIYFNRVGKAQFTIIFAYWNYIAASTYLLSILSCHVGKKYNFSLDSIFSSRAIFYCLITIFSLAALLTFRNDYADLFGEHQITTIHGSIMRTFNEDNLERIFMVFPAHIFFIGLCYLTFVFKKQTTSTFFKIFLIALLLPNLFFLYEKYNSPMLYWAIRRYIPVVLPAVFLGYVFFLKDMSYRQRMIVILTSFLIMANIFLEARQRRDYKGLDVAVETFTRLYDEKDNYLFLYEKKLRYPISSLMSYGKYDFFPVNSVSEIPIIVPNLSSSASRNVVFVSRIKLPIQHKEFTIKYQKVRESFYSLPTKYYQKEHLLYFYDIELLTKSTETLWRDGILWPNIKVNEYSGFYGKTWTNGSAQLKDIDYQLQPQNSTIAIFRNLKSKTPYSNVTELGLRVFVNNIEAEFQQEVRGFKYIFLLPEDIKTIKTIKIRSNTFIPKQLGYSQDERNMGIKIKAIRIE